jgi:membrane protein CcdC involved in cytochrome C biogenesis
MIIYGLGYSAIYLLFALLNLHASRMRQQLELTATELLDTRAMAYESFGLMSIGLFSAFIAALSKPQHAGLSGFIYILIGPMITVFRSIHRTRRRRLEAQLDREAQAAEQKRSSAAPA